MQIIRLTENTLLLEFDQRIDESVLAEVCHLQAVIQQELSQWIVDMVPAYASLHIRFAPSKISGADFHKKVWQCVQQKKSIGTFKQVKRFSIPVYYHADTGADLESIALEKQLSVENIIRLHSEREYSVYALGFAPGFAYLGSVDAKIATPRKHCPRAKVPAGSVAIAGEQTAVYPADSPGGWQLIGRTPQIMVDYESNNISPLKVGDKVRFLPIDRETYIQLGGSF